MRCDAAVLRSPDGRYEIEPIDLDDPGPGEVLVSISGTGMCHTDLLFRVPGLAPLPAVPGHEGAGIVRAVPGRQG